MVKIDVKDIIGMIKEGFDMVIGGDILDFDGFIVGVGDEEVGIGGEGEVGDVLVVVEEFVEERESGIGWVVGIGVGGFVGGGGGEKVVVGGEFDGGDGVFVGG